MLSKPEIVDGLSNSSICFCCTFNFNVHAIKLGNAQYPPKRKKCEYINLITASLLFHRSTHATVQFVRKPKYQMWMN